MVKSVEFDKKIKKSFDLQDGYFSTVNENYFDEKYKEKLKVILEQSKVFDKYINEWKPPSHHKKNKNLVKMCSIASSSRLCFLYFYERIEKAEIEVEKICPIKLIASQTKAHLDAYDKENNIYYECKCHEICTSNHYMLKDKYGEILKKIFDITISEDNIIAKERKGKNEKYIKLSLNDLGIETEDESFNNYLNALKRIDKNIKINVKNRSVYKLHFDVKQLICHLIGIKNNNETGKEKILKYIFFTPKDELIECDKDIKNLYEVLEIEFSMIKNSRKISQFLEENGIKLEYETIPVTNVDDIVIKNF